MRGIGEGIGDIRQRVRFHPDDFRYPVGEGGHEGQRFVARHARVQRLRPFQTENMKGFHLEGHHDLTACGAQSLRGLMQADAGRDPAPGDKGRAKFAPGSVSGLRQMLNKAQGEFIEPVLVNGRTHEKQIVRLYLLRQILQEFFPVGNYLCGRDVQNLHLKPAFFQGGRRHARRRERVATRTENQYCNSKRRHITSLHVALLRGALLASSGN
ncbi:MAG: hypothetical protein BWX80_01977 [Candidatus Hydrogenedentes bacterium ADurb.Bin101]|nr:MAG: hypothetical protein BWX80_01977 [Candidatus Hydrogenedentes bacterium ADurb.Bin101]